MRRDVECLSTPSDLRARPLPQAVCDHFRILLDESMPLIESCGFERRAAYLHVFAMLDHTAAASGDAHLAALADEGHAANETG